jgi:hypothetical protein
LDRNSRNAGIEKVNRKSLHDKTQNELREALERYGSLEKIAEELRQHPGFEKLNRATVSRWVARPTRRAMLAVQLLSSKRSISSLPTHIHIAEPRSLWVLPSTVLGWEGDEDPYGLLDKRYGIKVKVTQIRDGSEALKVLKAEEVDVALLAPELLSFQDTQECFKLCTLSTAFMIGIANRKVETLPDMKGMRIGFPAGSAVGEIAERWYLRLGFELPSLVGLTDIPSFVRAVNSREIDCVLAWEPMISYIKRRAKGYLKINSSLLPQIEIAVCLNRNNVSPALIRSYLLSLTTSAKYVEANKQSHSFHLDIARRLKMEPKEVGTVLGSSMFYSPASDLEILRPVLTLWEQDILSLNNL